MQLSSFWKSIYYFVEKAFSASIEGDLYCHYVESYISCIPIPFVVIGCSLHFLMSYNLYVKLFFVVSHVAGRPTRTLMKFVQHYNQSSVNLLITK